MVDIFKKYFPLKLEIYYHGRFQKFSLLTFWIFWK